MSAIAVVVGLGLSTEGILRQIAQEFDQQGAAQAFAGLWLTPIPVAGASGLPSTIKIHSLALTKKALNALYFDPQVKAWCAPNWKHWGPAKVLASSRLYGKLAVWHQLSQIDDAIRERIQAVIATRHDAVHLYLVAPLHDPFASGGLIDLAYLLHSKARFAPSTHAVYRVFGLLLAPGVQGDPLHPRPDEPNPPTMERSHQRDAIYHAALRELKFAGSKDSFYKSHHATLGTKVDQDRACWPFVTGDCFIVGGKLEKSHGTPTSAPEPYQYKDLIADTARFMAVHTLTGVASYLPKSTNARGGIFSSFGIILKTAAQAQRQNLYQRAMVEALVVRLQGSPSLGMPTVLEKAIDQVLELFDVTALAGMQENTQAAERSFAHEKGLLGTENNADNRLLTTETHDFRLLEERYQNALDKLFQLHVARSKFTQLRLDEFEQQQILSESATSDLAIFRQQPGMTLADLEHWHTRLLERLTTSYEETKATLSHTEAEVASLQLQLREAFVQTGYSQLRIGLPFRILMIAAALTFGSAVFAAGYLGEALMWGALAGTGGLWFANRTLSNKQRTVYDEYVAAQTRLIDLQDKMSVLQLRCTFKFKVLEKLRASFGRVARLGAPLKRIETEIKPHVEQVTTVPPYLRITDQQWEKIAVDLVNQCWRASPPHTDPSVDSLWMICDQAIQEHNLLREDDSDLARLQETVADAVSHISPLLDFVAESVDQTERTKRLALGLSGWGTLSTRRSFLEECDAQHITPYDWQWQLPQAAPRGVILIEVKVNIPVSGLRDTGEEFFNAYNRKPEQAGGRPTIHRSWLHPTRVGVAAPGLSTVQLPAFEVYPLLPMAAVLFLLKGQSPKLLDLCRWLNVPQRGQVTSIDMDELAGALSDPRNEAVISHMFRFSDSEAALVSEADITLVRSLLPIPRPKTSETWADWQVWQVAEIERLCTQHAGEALRLLCQLACKIVDEYGLGGVLETTPSPPASQITPTVES